jgi:ribosomal protein S3
MKERKPSPDAELIGYELSTFYLIKNNHDYQKAAKEVISLNITDIEVQGEEIHIYLNRPGLIIGRKGENIDALTKFLGKTVKIHETFSWNEIIVPLDYRGY